MALLEQAIVQVALFHVSAVVDWSAQNKAISFGLALSALLAATLPHNPKS
jgi:hypothetical protein